MRIRQIKPEFWGDPVMAKLPGPVRLTFIGLWNIADDAGWFVHDVSQIAYFLYGYEGRVAREEAVAEHLEILEEAGRVRLLACGHAVIPTFERHQRLRGGTTRVESVKTLHGLCPHNPAQPRTTSAVTERNVVERSGTVARPRDDAPEGSSRGASLKEILPEITALLASKP